jgi:hypothetical protein
MIDTTSHSNFAPLETTAFKNEKFNELFAVLEDLLKRIADTDDPDIRAKRAQVRAEMIAVQRNPHTRELEPAPAKPPLANSPLVALDETEADWGQQALVALAGAAMALSVFRHSS